MKKTQYKYSRSHNHRYKEIKEKVYQNSVVYIWTVFERQVQDMYASQKFQVISSPRRPDLYFLHKQGHQQACELRGLIDIIKVTIITVHQLEQQKTVNSNDFGKRTSWFSEVLQKLFCHYLWES